MRRRIGFILIFAICIMCFHAMSVLAAEVWRFPLDTYSYIGCKYGCSESHHSSPPHRGLDLPAAPGTPIKAVQSGNVERATYGSSEGNYVMIRHDNGLYSAYKHMTEYIVSVGSRVAQGQVIGYVGSTGYSSGAHLHFEMGTGAYYSTTIDPLNNSYAIIDPNNPNGTPTTAPVAPQNIRSNKKVYKSSESIEILWDSSAGATEYWIYMWKDGVQLYQTYMGTATAFTSAPTSSGNYTIIVRAGNSAGFNGASYSFTVTDNIPDAVKNIRTNKSEYFPYDDITFTWDSAYGTEEYWAYLWKDGGQIESGNCWGNTSYSTKLTGVGRYTLIVRPGNVNGFNEGSQSYSFSVGTYNINYNANGGINSPASQVKEQGVRIAISSTIPEREGYTFMGWSTSPYGEVEYNVGDWYHGNADLTLYAVWRKTNISTAIDYTGNKINLATTISLLSHSAKYTATMYDKDGVLLETDTFNISANTLSAGTSLTKHTDAEYIKVFLWDEKLKPIVNAEVIPLK